MLTTNQKQRRDEWHSLRTGLSIDEIFELSKVDRWFLTQIKEIVDFEEELARVKD